MKNSIKNNYGKREITSNSGLHFHKSYIYILHTKVSEFLHHLDRPEELTELQHVPPCCNSTIQKEVA